jgi:hypothetical protein
VSGAEANYSMTLRFDLFSDYSKAVKVLAYVNNVNTQSCYELLGVFCQSLEKMLGSTAVNDSLGVKLGIDIDIEGLWPIKEELFAAVLNESFVDEFKPALEQLNSFGLFDRQIDAKQFLQVYDKIQQQTGLEHTDINNADYIELFKMKSLFRPKLTNSVARASPLKFNRWQ